MKEKAENDAPEQTAAVPPSSFYRDVVNGLTATPKYLHAKYFYDAEGSKLFQQIMHMQEYYLTNSELEILNTHATAIYSHLKEKPNLNVVELGAGDGLKTKVLLKKFLQEGAGLVYFPIDISTEAINQLKTDMNRLFPQLPVKPYVQDFFAGLHALKTSKRHSKLVLFLGSNLGNYTPDEAEAFLEHLAGGLNSGDYLLLGLDLQKDPNVIQNAYNDPHGITRAFNMNIINRIARELDIPLNPKHFTHHSYYDPADGALYAYLISNTAQKIPLPDKNQSLYFRKWEPVFVEISRKFTPHLIAEIAQNHGFNVVANYTDSREYFVNSLWQKK